MIFAVNSFILILDSYRLLDNPTSTVYEYKIKSALIWSLSYIHKSKFPSDFTMSSFVYARE